MKKLIVILAITYLPLFLAAQNTMYFMERLPQSRIYNPAFNPDINFYLELPGIGGISTNAYNSGFNIAAFNNFSDNLKIDGYNPNEFINSLEKNNTFLSETRVNVLSFGFKLSDNDYFSFNSNINNITSLDAESDVIYLLSTLDDIDVADFPIIIDNLNFTTNTHLSIGFTYSRKINENLTLGISPHLNSNLIGIKTGKIRYEINIDETGGYYNEYDKTFDGEVIVGLPFEINPDAIEGNEFDLEEGIFPENFEDELKLSNYFKNKTLSVDLGATYKLDKWFFSASLLNIGASKWKTNGYILNGNDESIHIKGNEKIKIGIPANLYLGANYQFSPKWNYGFVFNNTFYDTQSKASATLSLNGYVGSALSTSVSYTAGYKFNNLGLGFRLRFFPGTDLYFVTDNIIQAFSYKNAYRLTAALGINFSFGVKNKKVEISDIQNATTTL